MHVNKVSDCGIPLAIVISALLAQLFFSQRFILASLRFLAEKNGCTFNSSFGVQNGIENPVGKWVHTNLQAAYRFK